MAKKILAALLIVAVVCGAAYAAGKKRTITFATDATWPPMEFMDAKKQITGFSIDYMTAAAKEAGFDAKFQATAWDGIFGGLEAGQYDAVCSSVSITEERKKTMAFSEPYYQVKQAVVVPKGKKIKALKDLAGKDVGSQISTTGTFAVQEEKSVKSKTYDDVGLAFEDLYNGRIAAVVCDDVVASQYALRTPKYSGKFVIGLVIQSKTAEYYGIAVKKDNAEVLALVNKGIAAVKKKGIDKKLQQKWMGGKK